MLNFGANKKSKFSVEVHGKAELDVFYKIIKFSKEQIHEEMKTILNAGKDVENKIENSIFKYNIICEMQNTLADIDDYVGIGNDETIYVEVEGPEEAELMAEYAAKMFDNLLKQGFNDKNKDVENTAMNITYSSSIFGKLSKIASLSATKPE